MENSEDPSDSFTILGLWVLGLTVSHINESQLQIYESRTLFLMCDSLKKNFASQRQNYAQKMQDAQVTKSLDPDQMVSDLQCFQKG